MSLCKDCRFRGEDRYCENKKLTERDFDYKAELNTNDDYLIYSYFESGGFEVGDNFGCVHFEAKK